MKKIAVLGTGYVGLVTGTCFANQGNHVTCIDIDKKKIEMLSTGKVPIYERSLEELVQKNLKNGRLQFTTDAHSALYVAELVFICLPTPSTADGHCDISYLLSAAETIGKAIDGYKIIVNKSTAPPGTMRTLEAEIRKYTSAPFAVASNPEFLQEGSALENFLRPDRIVIGTDDPYAAKVLTDLYVPFTLNNKPIKIVKPESAEEGKLASNAFLATKISFINEVAVRCEEIGADVKEVAWILGSDSRIGDKFLHAGPGYGGSCFPKDLSAMIADSRDRKVPLRIVEAAHRVNAEQKLISAQRIENLVNGAERKKIGVWGLAFKANTDDIREAPALTIITYLLEKGAHVHVHDPQALENTKKYFQSLENTKTDFCHNLFYYENMYDACKESNALVILTDWDDYKDPDFALIKQSLVTPRLIDLRNLYYQRRHDLRQQGFLYTGKGT